MMAFAVTLDLPAFYGIQEFKNELNYNIEEYSKINKQKRVE